MNQQIPITSNNQRSFLIRLLCAISIAALCSLSSSLSWANNNLLNISSQTSTTTQSVLDPLSRDNPRGTVQGFISAMASDDIDKAIEYFDLRYLTPTQRKQQGKTLVNNLKLLLNKQGAFVPAPLLSDLSAGHNNDSLDNDLDLVGNFKFKDQKFPIYVQRIKQNDGTEIWLFAEQTLRQIPLSFESKQDIKAPIDKILPTFFSQHQWGGAPIGQWIAIILLALGTYALARLITYFVGLIIYSFWGDRINKSQRKFINAFAVPARLYLSLWILVFGASYLGVSIIIRQYFSTFTVIISWIAGALLLWNIINVLAALSERRMRQRNHVGGLSAVLFFQRSAKFVVIALGVIGILKTVGIDVTTWLAALGIGGLALALGAQKTIENLVGSLNIIFDQPVRVGDFCKVGEVKGTIEKIGMRSTRIRTLNRTLITIPNGDFSAQQIENYTHRDSFIYHPTLTLRYETSPDQMRYVLVKIREMLYAHPRIDPEPARVRFTEFGASALHIEILAYITAIDYHESLEVQEDLNLRIADIVKDSGSGFAYPSQTLYIAQDTGLDGEHSRAAEQQVRAWREQGELHIPSFDNDTRSKLKNSIEYPAAGSSATNNKQPPDF